MKLKLLWVAFSVGMLMLMGIKMSLSQAVPDVTSGMDRHGSGWSIIWNPEHLYGVYEVNGVLESTEIFLNGNALPDVQGFYSHGGGWSVFWTPSKIYSLYEIDGVLTPAEITFNGSSIPQVKGCFRHGGGWTVFWTPTKTYSLYDINYVLTAAEIVDNNGSIAGTQGVFSHGGGWSILWTPEKVYSLYDINYVITPAEILFNNNSIPGTRGLFKHGGGWSILWTSQKVFSIYDINYVLTPAEITVNNSSIPGIEGLYSHGCGWSIMWSSSHVYSIYDINYVLTPAEIIFNNAAITLTKGIYQHGGGWTILWTSNKVYSIYDINYVLTPAEVLFNGASISGTQGVYRHGGGWSILWTPSKVLGVFDINYVLTTSEILDNGNSITSTQGMYLFFGGHSILWTPTKLYDIYDINFVLTPTEILYENTSVAGVKALYPHGGGYSLVMTPKKIFNLYDYNFVLTLTEMKVNNESILMYNPSLVTGVNVVQVQTPIEFTPGYWLIHDTIWFEIDTIFEIIPVIIDTLWGAVINPGPCGTIDTLIYYPDSMFVESEMCYMVLCGNVHGVTIMGPETYIETQPPDVLNWTGVCDTCTINVDIGPIVIMGNTVVIHIDTIWHFGTWLEWIEPVLSYSNGIGIVGTPVATDVKFTGQPAAVLGVPVSEDYSSSSTTVWAVEQMDITNPDYNYLILGPDPVGGVLEGDAVKLFGYFKRDWGDAPDPTYPTLSVNNGASHGCSDSLLFLGELKDYEIDGQPDSIAKGDDLNSLPDEDGVVFNTPLNPGQTATLSVTASLGGGLLNAWIDYNRDGDWDDSGEQIFINDTLAQGVNFLTINVPANAVTGVSFARFRYANQSTQPTGFVSSGEVEDYTVNICIPPVVTCPPVLDLCVSSPPFTLTGATPPGGVYSENGIPLTIFDPATEGAGVHSIYYIYTDPLTGCADACGFIIVVNTVPVVNCPPGIVVSVNDAPFVLTGGSPTGGNYQGPGVTANTFYPSVAGVGLHAITYTYIDPVTSCSNNCSFNITCLSNNYDFGDAPDPSYPTKLNNNGARHLIINGINLGNFIDAENNGLPTNNASGDDLNNLDDEDGVIKIWGDYTGSPVNIKVIASVSGYLDAWMDFNGNGSWADAGEQIFTGQPLNAGENILNFLVPESTVNHNNFARFRYSLEGGLNYNGEALNGEVEDYQYMFLIQDDSKWIQPCDPALPGIPAYSSANIDSIVGDDWLCYGGVVTNIHWFGNYMNNQGSELRGSGINHFHLEIHANDDSGCTPLEPPLYSADIQQSALNETFTGLINSDFSAIYEYTYLLPAPFEQIPGQTYWLNLTAFSNDSTDPAKWRWQEAAQSDVNVLCSAARQVVINGVPGNWSPVSWPANGRNSDNAFVIGGIPVPSAITGNATYNNALNSPMTNTKVYLNLNNIKVDSTLTGTTGFYEIDSITPGNYSMNGFTSKPWGGGNAGDALLCLKVFVGIINPPPPGSSDTLWYKACDVTGDGKINALDALSISRRFVGLLQSFPAGDWIFEKPKPTVTQGNIYNINIKALCYGDPNKSHTPTFIKSTPGVQFISEGFIASSPDNLLIPVKATENLTAAALSLVLSCQANWTILDIIPGTKIEGEFMWNRVDGMLRISWYSLNPMQLQDNEVIFMIKVDGKTVLPGNQLLTAGPESVISDQDGKDYDLITLSVPSVIMSQIPDFWLGFNIPNPFVGETEIGYSIPENGRVTLKVMNSLGEVIAVLINDEYRPAGKYQLDFDCSACPAGVYHYQITVKTATATMVDSKTMILQK